MSTKIRTALLTVAFVMASISLSSVPASANGCGSTGGGTFAGGDGLVGSPFLVSTGAQLASMEVSACLVNGYFFSQTADLDLTGITWTPIGTSSAFNGKYDGGLHTITGLDVTASYAGLFGTVDGGIIKNLKIVDASVTSTTSNGGGLASTIKNGTIISQVSFTGRVSSQSTVGGLVGFAQGTKSTISYSSVHAALESTTGKAGGIIGASDNNSVGIDNSLFGGSVASDVAGTSIASISGGIAGYMINGTIDNVYSFGAVSGGGANRGGVLGAGTASVSNSFFLDTSVVQIKSNFATSKLSSELATSTTYSNASWSVIAGLASITDGTASATWFMDPSLHSGYPLLTWEYLSTTPADCAIGRYSGSGVTPCRLAPIGSYVSATGQTAPTPCVPGTFQSAIGASSCDPTTAGHFTASSGSSAQVECPVGKWQSGTQQSSCLDARAGKYVALTASIIDTSCAPGTFQASTGQVSCDNANAGYFVAEAGSIAEVACAAGTFQSVAASISCVAGQPGYFVAVSGSSVQTQCPAGTTSGVAATACSALPVAYSGPIFTGLSNLSVVQGQKVRALGSNLAGVISVEIAGVSLSVLASANSIEFVVPAALASGAYDIKVYSNSGVLVVQDALMVSGTSSDQDGALSFIAASWTKNLNNGSVKLYAKNIIGAGKVQMFFNGKEIAWVRAVDGTNSKLRTANGASYLVRTVDLVEGQKNVLEIYVDGVRTARSAYSY